MIYNVYLINFVDFYECKLIVNVMAATVETGARKAWESCGMLKKHLLNGFNCGDRW